MGIPLFEDLDIEQIERILKVCTQRKVQPGDVLCESMTIDAQLLIFLNGKLRLESDGGERLAEMTQTRVLGEMGVITGQPRHSRVMAEEVSTVLELQGSDLQEMVEADPEMGYQLLLSLVKLLYIRTSRMNEDIVGLEKQSDRLRQRLAELAPDDPLLSEG
jgi:CRP-like cAMP-binding protein